MLDSLDLVDSVAPIQLTTRLLVPEGSLLLDLPGFAVTLAPFDAHRLVHPWTHPDPDMDALQLRFEAEVAEAGRQGWDRRTTFDRLGPWPAALPPERSPLASADIPQFLEPWFCCSEPVSELVTGWTIPEP